MRQRNIIGARTIGAPGLAIACNSKPRVPPMRGPQGSRPLQSSVNIKRTKGKNGLADAPLNQRHPQVNANVRFIIKCSCLSRLASTLTSNPAGEVRAHTIFAGVHIEVHASEKALLSRQRFI